ncbi:phage tail assembly chaperone [Klebsiella pasteurii]|uniref:phage tail assembly chaperone n=1 Tax=Klebsiella pasteurii TaxID=2587529 RepID=UPI0022473A0A|nr:phage tail assembly chaperone [Klebsiella pasteurii]MCW9583065.1 phage tail assembly chaperone [Klebsiella pasteurii]
MSAIFKLQPNPIFKADVAIPRAGEEDGVLNFTFKHRPIKELAELEDIDEKTICDFLLEIVDGWALSEPCTRENIGVLVDNYPGAVKAIMATYYQELTGNREKN